MKLSEQYYLGEFEFDEQLELFVKAWIAYYCAANKVDGHLSPGHPDQSRLAHFAVKAGHEDMTRFVPYEFVPYEVIRDAILRNDIKIYSKWKNAKIIALRRLGLD